MVPAFDADGEEVNAAIRLCQSLPAPPSGFYVELDNAQHVTFSDPCRSGKLAKWLVGRFRKLSKKYVRSHDPIGMMDDAGLMIVVQTVLDYSQSVPSRFSLHSIKKLTRLAEEIQTRLNCA